MHKLSSTNSQEKIAAAANLWEYDEYDNGVENHLASFVISSALWDELEENRDALVVDHERAALFHERRPFLCV